MRKITALCFALLSLSACEKTIYMTAPPTAQEEKIPFQQVAVGDNFIVNISIPVIDPNDGAPVSTVDFKNGLASEIASDSYKAQEVYTGSQTWYIQFLLNAKTVGTETITIKVSTKPDMYWTQKILIIPNQKG